MSKAAQYSTSASSSLALEQDKKRFVCPECQKEFTRHEHMKRHRLLHTSTPRPFKCSKCARSFTRQDALFRHTHLHRATQPILTDEVLGNPRRRAAVFRTRKACDRCSRLKLKCNGDLSCPRCQASNSKCQYSRPEPISGRIRIEASPLSDSASFEHNTSSMQGGDEDAEDSQLMMESMRVSLSEQQQQRSDDVEVDCGEDQQMHSHVSFAFPDTPIAFPNMQGAETADESRSTAGASGQEVASENMIMAEDFETTLSSLQAGFTPPNDILPSSEFDWLFATHSPTTQLAQASESWVSTLFVDTSIHQQAFEVRNDISNPLGGEQTINSTAVRGDQSLLSPRLTSDRRERSSLDLLSSTALDRDTNQYASGDTTPVRQSRMVRKLVNDLEPRDLRAPSRRNSLPGAANSREWPNSWYPDAADMRINADIFANATEEIILMEDTTQVEAFDERAKARLLTVCQFAELPEHEGEQVHLMLSNLSCATYNVMLQLFFEHFQPSHPFIHRSTFQPSKCNIFLLGSVCAVGTFYTQTPKARNLGNVLIDLIHRAIIMSTTRNNLHARSLSNIQALVLICIYMGNSGNRRFLEHAEACRGAVITMVRRCRLLDAKPPPAVLRTQRGTQSSASDKNARWRAWLHWEMGRRTGWACFVADMELSSAWNLPPSFLLTELQTSLPSKEDVWEAPNADIWSSLFSSPEIRSAGASVTTVMKLHEAFDGEYFAKAIEQLDVFQTVTAMQSISLLSQSIIELLHSSLAKQARALGQPFLLSIGNNAAALNRVSKDGNSEERGDRLKYATAEILFHFIALRLFVDLHDLQALCGRRGAEEAQAANRRLVKLFRDDFATFHTVAQHASRTIHLAINYPIGIASLGTTLFYSVVYLYAFSMTWSAEEQQLGGGTGANMRGVPIIVDRVGDLASQRAPKKILTFMSNFFQNQLANRTWPTCKNLGVILSDMAEKAA